MSTRQLKGAARYKTRTGYEAAKAKANGPTSAKSGSVSPPKKKQTKKDKPRDRDPAKVGVRQIKRGRRKVDDTKARGRSGKHFKGKKPQPEKYGPPERSTLLPSGRIQIKSSILD